MRALINSYLYATMLLYMLNASIHTKFSHFEILKPSNIRVRVKRDSASGQVVFKSLKFFALGNQFNITLKPGSPVIDPVNFEVKLMDASGKVTYHKLRGYAFYEGRVMGQRSSFVDAAYIGGVWSAHVQTSHDSFFIEPLHKHDESGARHNMVIYRQTALKLGNNTSFVNLAQKTFCRVFSVNGTASPSREDSWSRHGETNDKLSLNPEDVSSTHREPHETKSTGESLVEDLPTTGSKSAQHFPEARISRDLNAHETPRLRRRFTNDLYRNTCDMLAIMDTVTFLTVGQGSVHKSAAMLVYWYQLADRIFKRAQFGVFSGMRLKVKTILVLTEYTRSPRRHFNSDPAVTTMCADDVLASLTNNSWFNNYCLVHLTTARHFQSSILGLATIANVPKFDPKDYRYKDPFWKSGICSANAQNAAFSCLKMENIILTDPMYLVIFVHEIAHGWGAEHDEYENNCAPPEHHGGKYIMWYNHNGAKSPNSFKFSGCSGAQIQDVLLYKSHKCLLPHGALKSVCGNSILEYPEECDEGLLENSSCCTSNCRIHDDAVCSSFNHPCCTTRCTLSPSTQECFQATNMSCSQKSFCDGLSYDTCPQPSPLPNGSPCEDRGSCWHGVCLSYCENKGRASNPARALVPCTCDTDRQAMCARCCAVAGTNSCLPEADVFDDGMPCLLGFCKGGVCVGTAVEQLGAVEEKLEAVEEKMGTTERPTKLTGDSLQNAGLMRYLVFIVLTIATPPFLFYTLCICLLGRCRKCHSEDVQENGAVEVVVVSERPVLKLAPAEELSHTLNMPSPEAGELKNMMKFKPSSTEV